MSLIACTFSNEQTRQQRRAERHSHKVLTIWPNKRGNSKIVPIFFPQDFYENVSFLIEYDEMIFKNYFCKFAVELCILKMLKAFKSCYLLKPTSLPRVK